MGDVKWGTLVQMQLGFGEEEDCGVKATLYTLRSLYGQAEGKIIADIGQELRHQETRDFFSVARRLFLKI
jgi:hypothetical protein